MSLGFGNSPLDHFKQNCNRHTYDILAVDKLGQNPIVQQRPQRVAASRLLDAVDRRHKIDRTHIVVFALGAQRGRLLARDQRALWRWRRMGRVWGCRDGANQTTEYGLVDAGNRDGRLQTASQGRPFCFWKKKDARNMIHSRKVTKVTRQ
jgi:hypothetical protein